jgi:hypothetical protein
LMVFEYSFYDLMVYLMFFTTLALWVVRRTSFWEEDVSGATTVSVLGRWWWTRCSNYSLG